MFGIGYQERMQKQVGDKKSIINGSIDETLQNCKAKSQNIQKLFQNQTAKESFYQQVKNPYPRNLVDKQLAIQNYFEQLGKIPSMIPKPSFLKIEDNWVKFTEETISENQAKDLKQYFDKT